MRTAKDSTSIHYPLWDVIRECGELESLITQVINPSSELDFTSTAGLIIISHITDSTLIITPNIKIDHAVNLWPQPASVIYILYISSVLSLIDQHVVWDKCNSNSIHLLINLIVFICWFFCFVFLRLSMTSVFDHCLCP